MRALFLLFSVFGNNERRNVSIISSPNSFFPSLFINVLLRIKMHSSTFSLYIIPALKEHDIGRFSFGGIFSNMWNKTKLYGATALGRPRSTTRLQASD